MRYSAVATGYGYDKLNRLTSIQQGAGAVTTLAYDKGGNRLSERDQNGERGYNYAAGTNRLMAETATDKVSDAPQAENAWLYQATGVPLVRLALLPTSQKPVLSEASRHIIYNGARRIAVYDAQRQLIARYFYSADGERIAKSVYPVRRENLSNASTAQPRTTYSLYRSADSTANIYAIHTDHLGTPQAVTDENEQLVWQAETTPFGQAKVKFAAVTGGDTFDMKQRLPGQVCDAETGLNQNYYRDYDPRLGRYLTADPLGVSGGMNPYAYVNSNPLTDMDPLGLYQIDFHYYMVFYLGLEQA
jgi:RHS repeat-associated protein